MCMYICMYFTVNAIQRPAREIKTGKIAFHEHQEPSVTRTFEGMFALLLQYTKSTIGNANYCH